jgi:hypothetical protein
MVSGWEGSAADGTLFSSSCFNDLAIPSGKYYLVLSIPTLLPSPDSTASLLPALLPALLLTLLLTLFFNPSPT